MIKTLACHLTLVVLAVVHSHNAYAQTCPGSQGCLDPTFGSGGVSTTYVPTTQGNLSLIKAVIQSDGKLVLLMVFTTSPARVNAFETLTDRNLV